MGRFALTYPVETAGSVEQPELPFVIGVLAQLSGDPRTRLPRIRERQFIEIDGDNFDAVLAAHQPPSNLEETWAALRWLVSRVETMPLVKIRVLDVTKKELLRDFQRAVCFDQSHIFRKVHDEIYGVTGAEPFSVLVGAYTFTQEPDDLELLKNLGRTAEVSRAPFLSAAGPRMFGCEDFAEWTGQGCEAVRKIIAHAEEQDPLQAFEADPDARYVCLAWPGFLLEPPQRKPRWGNPAFVLASTLASSFSRDGLCIDIVGEESGGRIEGLPFDRSAGIGPTEVWFEDDHDYMWRGNGFISITGIPHRGLAVILTAPTCHRPPWTEDVRSSASAFLYASLPLLMTESRVAHCVKAMVRDRCGRFESPGQCERFLNEWIARLIDPDEDPPFPPARPLQEGRIEVLERTGTPGYCAVVHLRPHWWHAPPAPTRIVLPLYLELRGENDHET